MTQQKKLTQSVLFQKNSVNLHFKYSLVFELTTA